MRPLLEICVDDADGLQTAIAAGADRIELCSALATGGLTPSPGLMALAARAPIPVIALVRPRPGGFHYSPDELAMMVADIAAVRAAGLSGVAIGALSPDGDLDEAGLKALLDAAAGLDLTLHRAFDMARDRSATLEQAVALGFRRILTSGGASTAPEAVDELCRLAEEAKGRIAIMPGSGIRAASLPPLLSTGLFSEFHASASMPRERDANAARMGFEPAGWRRTDSGEIAALRALLDLKAGKAFAH